MSADRVVRAMTNDGAFRVIAAITTATAQGAIAAQATAGALAGRLAELLTGAILVRETTAPGRRVQLVLRYQAGGSLIADSLPTGQSRGLITSPPEATVSGLAGNAILQVNYTLTTGALHQGVIDVPEGADMSGALMRYLHQSEQTVSMVVVESLIAGDQLVASGGYLVQLLPEASRDVIEAMTARLTNLERIGEILAGAQPSADQLIDALCGGFEHTRLAESVLAFGCTCSEDRLIAGIMSLPEAEVHELASAAEPLDVRCDACGRHYALSPATLRALAMRPRGESNA